MDPNYRIIAMCVLRLSQFYKSVLFKPVLQVEYLVECTSAVLTEEQEGPPPTNADQLQLAQFDIEKVLSHGASLLGSEGAEYDMQDEGMSE